MKCIALLMAKIASTLLHMIHRGGSFPGAIALKICPNIYTKLSYDLPVILVTGTNGKTSTSNMISDLFQANGKTVINNRKGDNLKEGIITSIIANASLLGKVHGDVMVLEVDELNIPYIMRNMKVSTLVVTNFFRDQLDRSKEMEQLIQKIEGAIQNFQGTLVLNGNDPNVVRLKDKAPNSKVLYFGADHCEVSRPTTSEASEGKFCPRCNSALTYDYYQYSHIGVFACSHCDYQTPAINCLARDICIEEGTFTYQDTLFTSPIHSLYTIYNCMAVLAIAHLYHIPLTKASYVFEHVVQPQGRNETFHYQQYDYTLNLVKNPTGANEVFKVIEQDKEAKAIMIVLNDHAQDGTDVSWIYDAQFERVLQEATQTIICSGTRAYDMALRIKYSNYKGNTQVIENYKDALDALYGLSMKSYVIATYTALAPVRAAMRRDA